MEDASSPRLSADAVWAGRGATPLWDAETRPLDGLRVLVALIAPFSLAAALLWFVVTHDARHYLGVYLTAGGLIGAAIWLVVPVLQARASREFIPRMLERAPIRGSEAWSETITDPLHRIFGIWLRGDYDVVTMRRHRISAFALWPLVRPYLSADERDLVASEAAQMRTAGAMFASSGVALVATAVTVAAAVLTSDNTPRPMLMALLGGTVCILLGSLLRFRVAAARLYSEKVRSILRHASDVTDSYGTAKTGVSPLDHLRSLSRRVLEGHLLAAEAADRGDLPAVETVRAAVRDSFQELLAPNPPIAMEGAIEARLHGDATERWTLDVEVRVDPAARAAAIERRGMPGVAAFRVSGGRTEPQVPVELVIDAPGLAVEAPAPLAAVLSTGGGTGRWRVQLNGPAYEDDAVWVSLYSVGRFVQAVPAATDS